MIKLKTTDAQPPGTRLVVIKGDAMFCYFADDPDVIEADTSRAEDQSRAHRNHNKAQRTQRIQRLTVTTSTGHEFNADETSQQRMQRAVAVLYPNELISWTLANNTVEFVTREELAEALRLAVFKQTELWRLPE